MTDDDVLAEFRAAEALLEGHFILSSGLRSPRYLQCARVLMSPARAERLAQALGQAQAASRLLRRLLAGAPMLRPLCARPPGLPAQAQGFRSSGSGCSNY